MGFLYSHPGQSEWIFGGIHVNLSRSLIGLNWVTCPLFNQPLWLQGGREMGFIERLSHSLELG